MTFRAGILFLLLLPFTLTAAPQTKQALTSEERDWITNNPVVSFTGDPNWLPYEAFDANGNYIGMVADHLALISEATGLVFKPRVVSSWTESLQVATAGEVQIISGDAADAILNQQFRPVDTYSQNPIVIVMDDRQGFVNDLEQIRGQRIAIIKDYGYTADIYSLYPDFEFIEVENIQEGLEGIAQGRIDAMLATMALASYHLAEMGLYNLRIVGKTPIIMDLTLFVAEDEKLLYSIINKTLNSLSSAAKQDIFGNWIRSKYVEKPDYTVAIIIGSGLLLLLFINVMWNRQQQQEIKRRRAAEAALQRSESLLRTVIDQMPDVFVLKDDEGNFLLANQAVASLYNTTPEAMVGKHDDDFGVPREMAESMRQSVLSVMRSGKKEVVYEDSRDAETGQTRHYRSIKTPMKDPDGNNQLLVIAQDITEIIESQQKVIKSEALLQNVLEVIREGVWNWHIPSGKVTHNEEWYRLLDARPGDIEDSLEGFSHLLYKEDRVKATEAMDALIRGETDTYFSEHRLVTKTGRLIWVQDRGRVTERDKDGKPLQVVGTFNDITDRKLAENALRQSEEKYRRLIENLTKEYFFYTNNHEAKFTYVSNSVTGMLGWTTKEFLDHYSEFVTDHPVNKAIEEKTQLGLKGIKQKPYQVVARHKDGSERWLEVSETPVFDERGNVVELEGLAHDITERLIADRKLRESEARFRQLFEATDAVAVQGYNRQRQIIYWNPASEKLYGYAADEAMGSQLEDLIIPEPMREAVIAGIDSWASGGSGIPSEEVQLRHADGHLVPVFSSHVMFPGKDGEPEMYCIDVDLTEQKQAREQVQLLSMAVEQSPVSVIITDANGTIEYVNSSFEKISGYRADEVIGQNPRMFKSGKTQQALYKQMWQAISSGRPWHGQLQNRTKRGEIIWENLHIAPVTSEDGDIHHYLAVKEDITLQKEQEEKILQQAHFDALTQLPNRFLGLDRLSQLLIEAERNHELVAVLFLDLDDFKKVNDSMGHDMGDKLLVEAAQRLRNSVRTGDTVGRLGGDEFIVLLGGLNEVTDTRSVVESMLSRFHDPFPIEGRELVMTLSIGIAVYPNDGDNASELLRNADSAMYHSKEQGRNTYSYFTESMNKDVSRRLSIEEQMHGALERGEFSLVYQPQCRIEDKQVYGAEALLRWHNPVLGAVMPDEFIQIAEQTGMIVPIGLHVLSEAVRQAQQWRQISPDFQIAVNLSPRQFRDPNLVDDIRKVLDSNAFPHQQLELEITEGVLMSGHAYIDMALSRLNDLEVTVAMDDFGTGYSSLSYLRSYPFNVLKIDRSFVHDITLDSADRELVNAAIAMAHGLGLKVIAEGVETAEQLELLREQHCDIAQGYYFSRPVAAEKLTALLKEGCLVGSN